MTISKKHIVIIMAAVMSFSCNAPVGPAENTKVFTRFEIFLADFLKRHPHYNQNSVIQEQVGEALKKEFYDSIPAGVLSDHPLKLHNIMGNEGNYYAHFEPDSERMNLHGTVNFDLAVKVDTSQVNSFIEGNHYYVTGKQPKDISRQFDKYIVSAYTPLFQISGDSTRPEISLGVTYVEGVKIEPANF